MKTLTAPPESPTSQNPNVQPHSYWGDTSDPSNHDPKNFRYHVHGFVPEIKDLDPTRYVQAALGHGMGDVSAAQGVSLQQAPERINERKTMSTSLIGNDFQGTYGKAGLIIGVPEEDVLITAPHDASVVHGNREIIEKLWGRYFPKLNADTLLDQSHEYRNNEVVVAAGRIALLGFFVKTQRNRLGINRPIDRQRAALVKKHARRLGKPLVKIEVPKK